MAKKTTKPAATLENGTEPTDDEVAQLKAQLAQLQQQLAEEQAKKRPSRPRKLTPEQEAKRAERAAWEHIDLANEASRLGQLQRKERIVQIDAFPKVARMVKWNDVAPKLLELMELAAEQTGRDIDDIMTEATTRTPKEQKQDEAAKLKEELAKQLEEAGGDETTEGEGGETAAE